MAAAKVSMLFMSALDADPAIVTARAAATDGTFPDVNLSVSVTGLMSGLSLIVATGAPNAFVLRQGLSGEHVFSAGAGRAISIPACDHSEALGLGRLLSTPKR